MGLFWPGPPPAQLIERCDGLPGMPGAAWPDEGAAGPLCVAQPPGEGGPGPARVGPIEPEGGERARYHLGHGQAAPDQADAEDGSRLPRRAAEDVQEAAGQYLGVGRYLSPR